MTNYFQYYDIAEALEIDLKELRMRYLAKSKESHPDFHTLAGADAQENALIQSTLNNAAYKTLKNQNSRIKHILELHDMIHEDDTVSQEFLMEAMDVNEAIMELQFDPSPTVMKTAQSMVESLSERITEEYSSLAEKPINNENLRIVKEWYYKKKYVDRMLTNLNKVVEEK